MSKKISTLCIVHQPPRVLLGMKKRGFGAGRWNGFGGKLQPNESLEEAARREMEEEAGVTVENLEKVGIIEFEFSAEDGSASAGRGEILEVHIFRAQEFTGELIESEEMKPQWFDVNHIPFSSMWPDDVHWFPFLLSGKKFRGRFLFGPKDAILEQSLAEVEIL